MNIIEVNYKTWTLKFNNFSEFQNFLMIAPPPRHNPLLHYLHINTAIDMWLTPYPNSYDAAFSRSYYLYKNDSSTYLGGP